MITTTFLQHLGRIINDIELALLKGLKDLGLLDLSEVEEAISELEENQNS